MVKSKNKAILIRMTEDLYSQIEEQVSKLNYSSMAEYTRNAIEEFIKENIEGGEYLTYGNVRGTFEEFAKVLKGIVGKVDEMESALINLSQWDNDRIDKLEKIYDELMLFDSITKLFNRIDVIEKQLGIKRNNNATS